MAERRAENVTLVDVAILRSEVERHIEHASGFDLHRVLLSDGLYIDEDTSSDEQQIVKYNFEVVVEVAKESDDGEPGDPVKMLEGEWKVLAQFSNQRDPLSDEDGELTYEVRQLIYGSVREHMLACIRKAGVMIDLPLQTRRPQKSKGRKKAKKAE